MILWRANICFFEFENSLIVRETALKSQRSTVAVGESWFEESGPGTIAHVLERMLTGENSMKICVFSYSFGRYLMDGRMGLFDVVAKTAQLGFQSIEFMGLNVPVDDPECARLAGQLKTACEDEGLTIVNYSISVADFLRAKGGWQAEVERLKGELNIAAALGAQMVRHDATAGFPEDHNGPTDFPAALDVLADGCRALTQYAEQMGIRTTIENHGYFVQHSTRCEALIKAVDHENFGMLVDIGNFLMADEDLVEAVTRMAPYAVHCHVKDFHIKPIGSADPGDGWLDTAGGGYILGSILGQGDLDVPGCIGALRGAGYDGFVSLEFEGTEDNVSALEIGLGNLRNYVELCQ